MLTRRAALLAVLAIPLGKFNALANIGGWLTIDLSQWTGLTIKHGKDTMQLTGREVFNILKGKE